MGTKGYKLDGFVKAVRTICAEDDGTVPLLSASCTIKENNQKVSCYAHSMHLVKLVNYDRRNIQPTLICLRSTEEVYYDPVTGERRYVKK